MQLIAEAYEGGASTGTSSSRWRASLTLRASGELGGAAGAAGAAGSAAAVQLLSVGGGAEVVASAAPGQLKGPALRLGTGGSKEVREAIKFRASGDQNSDFEQLAFNTV